MSKSSFFGLISIFLYVLSYTPLKRVSTISIFVGAVPGAIPFLLGYVAATDDFGLAAGTLFAIQFFGNSLISLQLLGFRMMIIKKLDLKCFLVVRNLNILRLLLY
jgi:hypothetical protein